MVGEIVIRGHEDVIPFLFVAGEAEPCVPKLSTFACSRREVCVPQKRNHSAVLAMVFSRRYGIE